MSERAIFLDRDNTIIEDKEGFISDPAKVRLLPGAATAIAGLRRLGYRIIVVSNQSGVARGLFDEGAVEAVNQEMCRQLREQAAAQVDASYYCPYHPEAVLPEYRVDHAGWRKPKPGMLKQAAEDFDLDLALSWMIGDAPRDIAAGSAAGCRTILLKDPEHASPTPSDTADTESRTNTTEGGGMEPLGSVSPNFIVKTLADAARVIAREGRNPHPGLQAIPLAAPVPPVSVTPPRANAVSQMPGPATPAAPTDADTLADALGRKLAATTSAVESLRGSLDQIATLLRQKNRVDEIPEFSLARMGAIIAQAAVALCVAVGIWDAVIALGATGTSAWYLQVTLLFKAGLWLLGALVLQGFVLVLYLSSRK